MRNKRITKICNKCNIEKELSEFYKDASKLDGLRHDCKTCNKQRVAKWVENNLPKKLENNKNWKHKNPDNARDNYYRRNYGITLNQYNELLEKQNHCCAICKRHESEFKTNLAVEHNHKTKEIQGLCCTYCNRNLLGKIRDAKLFHSAGDYLENNHTGWFVPDKKRKRPYKKRKNRDN